MTDAIAPSARRLALGERHLAMLAELGDIAMAVSRAYGASAIASAEATDMILKDDYFVPEVGRARACGGKDSAESFQKVTRAVRLTLMMEKQTLEWMEGRRSVAPEIVAPAPAPATNPPTDPVRRTSLNSRDGASREGESRDRDWATDAAAARRDVRRDSLDTLDPPDALFHAAFRETVDTLCADVGARADWAACTVAPPPPPDARREPAEALAYGQSP